MKKVICLIESLGSGGAERQMAYLACQLKQIGYAVEVWTYYPNDFYSHILEESRVEWRYIEAARSRYKRVFVLRKELLKSSPDIVIAYLDTCTILACVIKLLGAKFKVIVSDRNTTQELTFREKLKFFLYRWADYIVPNSYVQSDYIKLHYPQLAPKVKTITNFIDTEKFCPPKEKTANERLKILTVARIASQKNVLRLLEVVKELKSEGYLFKYDWYGDNPDIKYYNKCVATVLQYDISDVFEFHSQSQDIINEYQIADIFCLPSVYEGFPNVLCEAMSCGLPILCSRISEHRMILSKTSEKYFFNPSSLNSMLETFRYIMALSKDEYCAEGILNRNLALMKFDQKTFIRSYLEIISAI